MCVYVCIVGGARDPFNGPHVVILLSSDGLTVSVSRFTAINLSRDHLFHFFSSPFNRVQMRNNDIIIIFIVVYYM